MKSALAIVAFTNNSEVEGTIALLEVAIMAMDRSGLQSSAVLTQTALDRFKTESAGKAKTH